MDQFIKVAGIEGKVGGFFCRLPPLNENTGVLQCNGGKLEEAEDFECVFVVYCVLESK